MQEAKAVSAAVRDEIQERPAGRYEPAGLKAYEVVGEAGFEPA